MSRHRSIWSRMNRVRRITAMSMVVCYVLGQGFVSIPVMSAKTDDTPYPCQNHACGCSSAAQCWKACCCFTREQKIAWAKANNVAVPYHLLGEETMVAEKAKPTEDDGMCCSKDDGDRGSCQKKTCCFHRSCCSKKTEKHLEGQQAADEKKSRTISVTDVLACRGLQMLWVLTPPTLPGDSEEVHFTLSRSFEVLRWSDDVLSSVTRMPPIPPPRLG